MPASCASTLHLLLSAADCISRRPMSLQLPSIVRCCYACRAYLASLLDYLQGFHQRTQPLKSLVKQLDRLEDEFDAQWEAGTVPGWSDSEQAAAANGATTAAGALDVDAFDSVEELEQLGALEFARLACSLQKLSVHADHLWFGRRHHTLHHLSCNAWRVQAGASGAKHPGQRGLPHATTI